MRLLVCGSREWHGTWEDIAVHLPESDATIIHGACSRLRNGAQVSVDMLADFAARGLGLTVEPFPVDHCLDGPWPGAGPHRNARMLHLGKPDHGLAFGALWVMRTPIHRLGETPGVARWAHAGTGGMVKLMLHAGLPVRWVATPGAAAVDLAVMPDPREGHQ